MLAAVRPQLDVSALRQGRVALKRGRILTRAAHHTQGSCLIAMVKKMGDAPCRKRRP